MSGGGLLNVGGHGVGGPRLPGSGEFGWERVPQGFSERSGATPAEQGKEAGPSGRNRGGGVQRWQKRIVGEPGEDAAGEFLAFVLMPAVGIVGMDAVAEEEFWDEDGFGPA
jgi:hypothetical protein